MTTERFIWIRNWDRFQHYGDRRPPWIKLYVELLDDDTYLELSEHRALLLHRLWLAFASSRSRLRVGTSSTPSSTSPRPLDEVLLDTRSVSRHCHLRVTKADIEALHNAGYIEVVDSATLAARLQSAMPRARPRARTEAEEEKDKETPPTPPNGKHPNPRRKIRCPHCDAPQVGERALALHLQNVHDGPPVPLTPEEVQA